MDHLDEFDMQLKSSTECTWSTHTTETENSTVHSISQDSLPTTSATSKEPLKYSKEIEEEGVRRILNALTVDEINAMSDLNLPLRHFRADKGNIEKAIKRTKYAIKWRQDFGVKKILRSVENPTTEEEYEIRKILIHESSTAKIYVRNHDREGRATLYFYLVRENTYNHKHNMMHLVFQIEKGIACTVKNGFDKVNIIMDFTDWKLKDASSIETTKETIHILQDCYVERLNRVFMTNAPVIFRSFWNIAKPFIDPTTKRKIVFCSGKSGLREVEGQFDLNKLEKCAGGVNDLRPFDVNEYFGLPLNRTFDEME
jgi:hypothetical protein